MSIYSSFLIRCWTRRDGAEPTYLVEHVQSGQQFRTGQLSEAGIWIGRLSQQLAAEESAAPEEEPRDQHD